MPDNVHWEIENIKKKNHSTNIHMIHLVKSMHHVCNSTPVALQRSVSCDILCLQSLHALLKLTVHALSRWRHISAIGSAHDTTNVAFLVFELPAKNPEIWVANTNASVPAVVQPCIKQASTVQHSL